MEILSDFDGFLQNGDIKRMLLDLIEQSLVEGREKLGPRKIFFFKCGALPFYFFFFLRLKHI